MLIIIIHDKFMLFKLNRLFSFSITAAGVPLLGLEKLLGNFDPPPCQYLRTGEKRDFGDACYLSGGSCLFHG